MRLTADDVARVRIADVPDFADEFVVGGYLLANGVRTSRLARWRQEVAQRWEPYVAALFDLYTPTTLPGFLGSPVALDSAVPAAVPDLPTTEEYLRTLARIRPLTPFTALWPTGTVGPKIC